MENPEKKSFRIALLFDGKAMFYQRNKPSSLTVKIRK